MGTDGVWMLSSWKAELVVEGKNSITVVRGEDECALRD